MNVICHRCGLPIVGTESEEEKFRWRVCRCRSRPSTLCSSPEEVINLSFYDEGVGKADPYARVETISRNGKPIDWVQIISQRGRDDQEGWIEGMESGEQHREELGRPVQVEGQGTGAVAAGGVLQAQGQRQVMRAVRTVRAVRSRV